MKHIWTGDGTVRSPFNDVVIPDVTITEYVWKNLDKWSDKTAVICGVTDRKYTYIQMYRQSQIFGAGLRKKFNIKDGDVVVVMLPNSPEYPTVVLGVLTSGGIVSTLNPLYTVYEAQKQISTSEAKLIVTYPEKVNEVKEVLKICKLNIPVIAVDIDKTRPEDTVSFKELISDTDVDKHVLKEVKRSAQDTSLLLYSSGTTGLPKAVELTHRNIVANLEQQSGDEFKKFNDTTETNQDITLAYLPMFHCYGLSVICLSKLSVGLKLVTLPRFNPDTFLNALEKHKFGLVYVAPPTVLFLASSPLVKPKHFEKLQNVLTGAAPLPLADVERFLSKLDICGVTDRKYTYSQLYKQSQIFGAGLRKKFKIRDGDVVCVMLPNSPEYPTVVLGILTAGGLATTVNPVYTLGELLIKGPNVMKGYKNNPKANSEVFVDGWLRSGDLAKIDEDGYVFIADRLKELIKVNAYQVPPAELESIIREHPEVFDAAVVGIPDDKTGEKPKAFVVLNKDSSASNKDIMEYVNTKVAPYKRLKEVEFLEDIPKNPSGKILRRVLVQK
ncbi:jg27582 [Pararge aegeria aegeria]|uniref:Jg27582 protein n=1 Tax=Pararge aegeria aegeria TaxID=348720 RepID=A0A8S4SH22_9NEOP|nr:jg27582 [Pararge aegeria aegeria]